MFFFPAPQAILQIFEDIDMVGVTPNSEDISQSEEAQITLGNQSPQPRSHDLPTYTNTKEDVDNLHDVSFLK